MANIASENFSLRLVYVQKTIGIYRRTQDHELLEISGAILVSYSSSIGKYPIKTVARDIALSRRFYEDTIQR